MTVIFGPTPGEIKEKLGGYNDMPPNWEPIRVSEFLWRFQANWTREFRQVVLRSVAFGKQQIGERESGCNVYMWIGPDFNGVGWITHYNGMATRSETDAYLPEYFKWVWCEHDYETLEERMSWWKGRCKKCGYVKAVDSS